MGEPLSVSFLAAPDHARWAAMVAAAPGGSPYATPEYLEALCEATGGTYRILCAERGGEIRGGVALYEERSRLGAFVSDRRLLFYNGIVLRASPSKYPSQRTARSTETLAALEAALAPLRYGSLRLKQRSPVADPRPFQRRGWTVSPAFTYVVSLGDLAAQWQRVEQNLRRLVDRCERAGVRLTEDDDFESFFRMHEQTHLRKGAPLYLPRDRFRRWFERLRSAGLARLFQARLPDGRSIAAQIVLAGAHPVTHTVAAAADAEHLALGANAFLRWRVFEALAKLGYAANDLTDATLDPVTHFKSQLGGDLETCWVLARPERLPWRVGAWALERARSWRSARAPADVPARASENGET